MTTLPNTGIVLPTRGSPGSGLWADAVDAALALLDAHDHTSGKGARVPTAGISINADLTFGGLYAPTNLQRLSFASVAALASNSKSLFVSDGSGGLVASELYWRSIGGVNVRLTSGSALNVAAFTGGIGGDYASAGAALAFDDSNKRYTFKDGAANWARLASGDMRLFETGTAESVFVGLAAPAALAGSYTITMPLAAPGSTALVQMDSVGVLTASNVTIGGTPNFTGAVTMAAGLTLGSNQNVTLSGTGDLKHGSRTLVVSGGAFQPGNNYSSSNIFFDPTSGQWNMNVAPSDTLGANIPLRAGDRITQIVWFYNKNTSSSGMVFELTTRNGTTVATIDTSSDVTSGGTSTTRSSINHPIVSGDATFLNVQSSNSLHRFFHAVITYDHP